LAPVYPKIVVIATLSAFGAGYLIGLGKDQEMFKKNYRAASPALVEMVALEGLSARELEQIANCGLLEKFVAGEWIRIPERYI